MENKKSEGARNQDQHRIVIAKEANHSIDQLVKNINSGFDAGAVSKSDVANYLLMNLSRLIVESDIRAIRAQHFDAKKVLATFLKSSEELPEEIQRVLKASCGILDTTKKRSTKGADDLSTFPSVDNSKIA